jgi:hypothetical protein
MTKTMLVWVNRVKEVKRMGKKTPIALVTKMTNKSPILSGTLYLRSSRVHWVSSCPPMQCLGGSVIVNRAIGGWSLLDTRMEMAVFLAIWVMILFCMISLWLHENLDFVATGRKAESWMVNNGLEDFSKYSRFTAMGVTSCVLCVKLFGFGGAHNLVLFSPSHTIPECSAFVHSSRNSADLLGGAMSVAFRDSSDFRCWSL